MKKILINENLNNKKIYYRSSENNKTFFQHSDKVYYAQFGYGLYFSDDLDDIRENYNKGIIKKCVIDTNKFLVWEDNVNEKLLKLFEKDINNYLNFNISENEVLSDLKKNEFFEIKSGNKYISIEYDEFNEKFKGKKSFLIDCVVDKKTVFMKEVETFKEVYNIFNKMLNKLMSVKDYKIEIDDYFYIIINAEQLSFNDIKTNAHFFGYVYSLINSVVETTNYFKKIGCKGIKNNFYGNENICVFNKENILSIKDYNVS